MLISLIELLCILLVWMLLKGLKSEKQQSVDIELLDAGEHHTLS